MAVNKPFTITSDGTPYGTSVKSPNGEELGAHIKSLTWHVETNQPATVEIVLSGLAIVHLVGGCPLSFELISREQSGESE